LEGKKTQNDYNKELNQKFMNFIEDNFKEQISNYTNYSLMLMVLNMKIF
jgi:hypothetical protein